MTTIQVGERTLTCDSFQVTGEILSVQLRLAGATLAELAALFDGAPEIRALDAEGATAAIYRAHALTALTMETAGGVATASVTMQVEPLELTEADRLSERIDAQAKRLDAQQQTGDVLARISRARVQTAGISANEVIAMAPVLTPWQAGPQAVSEVRVYEGVPYRCIQAHDSTDNPAWTPPATPAMWAPYHATEKAYALPWQMPTMAEDAYNAGEWMIYTDGQTYRCTQDGTVWGPDQTPTHWEVAG